MIDRNLYRQYLLSSIPGSKPASGYDEVTCRCRECSDSSNPSSMHMYISIPKGNEPSLYNCFLCHASGVVTSRKLIEWNIYDKDIGTMIDEHNRSISGSNSRYFKSKIRNVRYYQTSNTQLSKIKRDYINKRLGTNLSYEDLIKLKIILNLKDVITQSGIYNLTRSEEVVDQLNKYFVGFLSVDNAFLNMRRICKENIVISEIDKRYVNYQLFSAQYNTDQRFYVVPTQVDLLSTERIELHVAEGPFDILSIYLNVRKSEPGIYACVAGSNYMNTLLYFLIDKKVPYTEIHFYPDNDKYGSIERIQEIIDELPDPSIPCYIHKNLYPNEKDFGVDINHIKESIFKVH